MIEIEDGRFEGNSWNITAASVNKVEEMDLRFWELHRLGPYLIVQSQYVLINKWALQVDRWKNTSNEWLVRQRKYVSLKTTNKNSSSYRLQA